MRPDPNWAEWERVLADSYGSLNYERGLGGAAMRRGHELLERGFSDAGYERVVEVGCGSGQHLEYVKHPLREYWLTDRSLPMLERARRKYAQLGRAGVASTVADASQLPFSEGSVDRLIAAHVLEHLYRPHEVLREWHRVLRPGGVMSILLPTDPGLAWRLARSFGTRRSLQSRGLPYDYLMAREHVNPINNLLGLLRYYFPDRREHWWPLGIPSMDLNFFYCFHTRKTL